MNSPFAVIKDFEKAVSEYTGAPFVVAVNSCTMAMFLALLWMKKNRPYVKRVCIPKRTYVSAPMVARHAGFAVVFEDREWLGQYGFDPLPIYDSARWFTSQMFVAGEMQCVSFHATKTLGDTQGGAILHDCQEADAWFRRMRFDGRTEGVAPKDDNFKELGWHCYMSPDVAARLLHKISFLPKCNKPLPNDDYPDLSKHEVFK